MLKKLFLFFCATATMFSCSTEDGIMPSADNQQQTEAVEGSRAVSTIRGNYLVSSTPIETYTAREYLNRIANEVDLSVLGSKSDKEALNNIVSAMIDRMAKWSGPRLNLGVLKFNTCTITYNTVDINGQKAVASARLLWPSRDDGISEVMLCCHGSMSSPDEAPTQALGLDNILCATGAFLVLPDYVGFGSTSDKNQNYLCSEITGKNSIHSLLAAYQYINRTIGIRLNLRHKTYIEGFSQGGQVALASLRYYQQIDTNYDDVIKLQKVVCGDGPYSLTETFNNYFATDNISFPMVGAMAVKSMKDAYGSSLGGYPFEAYFSQEAISSGLTDAVMHRRPIIEMGRMDVTKKVSELFSAEMLNLNSDMSKRFYTALQRHDLTSGWSPRYRLLFYHSQEDTVVPFVNYEKAYQNLSNKYVETPVTGNFGDHPQACINFFKEVLLKGMYQ